VSPARPDLRLIVITDAGQAAPRAVEDVVRAALQAGAPAIQLREKHGTAAALYRQAVALRRLTRAFDALLFINDRLDVALAAEADGLHLGPHDLPVGVARSAARRVRGPDFLIGFSTDDPLRARQARDDGAAYIGCGAVFGTASKAEVGTESIGTQRLADVVAAVDLPVVGIGGIRPHNVAAVARAGAAGSAVIGAIMTADDPGEVVRRLLRPFYGDPA
jgi:thiamine-phosphate pyrophosphorylase